MGDVSSANVRSGGFVDRELKYFDSSINATAVVVNVAGAELDPAGNCLCYPTQGSGATNRDGRRIVMKSLFIRGYISLDNLQDQTDPPANPIVRVLVVLDRQTNSAQLNSEDVLSDAGTTKALSFRNLEFSDRFKTISDSFYELAYAYQQADYAALPATASWRGAIKFFTLFKRLDIPVTFVANAGSVADISDNSLHVIAQSTNANVKIQYESRVRFVG